MWRQLPSTVLELFHANCSSLTETFLFQRRAVMILLYVAAPYGIDRLLEYVQRRVDRGDAPPELSRMASVIPAIRHAVTIIHRCHLALFYLRGVFYHLAKRFVGTRYVSRLERLTYCFLFFPQLKTLQYFWHNISSKLLTAVSVCVYGT